MSEGRGVILFSPAVHAVVERSPYLFRLTCAKPQIAFQATLCSFPCRMDSSVSFFDHRIGSKAEQATASVPTEAVIIAQPARF